ncbi:MAG: AroM family protein [Gemmatimonadota bacterium]|nr:AroM family protein [Gemmatimonadota bacterium]MDE3005741.1 AroM family protein [Gemmatimonadota bacterium]MDE3014696.1 AroM family protein [Gemmatimonadota bacterium]
MTAPLVRAYVIGQTPRPDLTADLEHRFPSTTFEVVGALDEVSPPELREIASCAYPLETRLRDGSRTVVDASYAARRIQALLDAYRGEAVAHVVLCAGPFPDLTVATERDRPRARLIRPFEVAVDVFLVQNVRRLEIVVPFQAQAPPAVAKWVSKGFEVRPHVLADRIPEAPLEAWLAGRVSEADADAIVFDYVGFPSDALSKTAEAAALPVFDLGHMALDALHDALSHHPDT